MKEGRLAATPSRRMGSFSALAINGSDRQTVNCDNDDDGQQWTDARHLLAAGSRGSLKCPSGALALAHSLPDFLLSVFLLSITQAVSASFKTPSQLLPSQADHPAQMSPLDPGPYLQSPCQAHLHRQFPRWQQRQTSSLWRPRLSRGDRPFPLFVLRLLQDPMVSLSSVFRRVLAL
jgi:hypothetical protein